jgi:hypothetical protein
MVGKHALLRVPDLSLHDRLSERTAGTGGSQAAAGPYRFGDTLPRRSPAFQIFGNHHSSLSLRRNLYRTLYRHVEANKAFTSLTNWLGLKNLPV